MDLIDFKQYLKEEERVDEAIPLIAPLLAGAARVLPTLARTATTVAKPLQTAAKVTKNVGRVTKPIKAGVGAVKKVGQELGTPAQQQQTDSPEERLAASTHYITNRWVKLLGEKEENPRYIRTRGGKKLTDKQQQALHDKLRQSQLDQFQAMEQAHQARKLKRIRDLMKKRQGGGDSSEGDEG